MELIGFPAFQQADRIFRLCDESHIKITLTFVEGTQWHGFFGTIKIFYFKFRSFKFLRQSLQLIFMPMDGSWRFYSAVIWC